MKSTKQATKKEVTVLSRLVIKADTRKVVYTVLSSDGNTKYETTLFDGKACSCQCLSRKPCYHMAGCEAREAARNVATVAAPTLKEQFKTRQQAQAQPVCREEWDDAEATRRAAYDIQVNPWFA